MPDKVTLPSGTTVPNHIAIILDGNRRWARSRGIPTLEGHKAGFEAGLKVAKASRDWGVHTFTVWGLSTENWDRSPKELAYLMKLYWKMVSEVEKEAKKDDIRFVHLGRKDRIPKALASYIKSLEDRTKNNRAHVFNAAIDYGGRDEIVRATRKIVDSGVKSKDVDEKLFGSYLDTGDQPYPNVDLFIRTSGEERTSGFLPWQLNYAEFYWEVSHLPDLTPEKLRDIIIDYSRRRRRFGGNDTVNHFVFDPKITARLELSWWRLAKIPEGMRIRDYAMEHIKEQFGLSKKLAFEAAKYFVEALAEEKDEKWDKATENMRKFYQLIKDEIKLAFEPKLVASMEVDLNRGKGENEEKTKEHLAEVYRISLFQAAKAAHLRVLAMISRFTPPQKLLMERLLGNFVHGIGGPGMIPVGADSPMMILMWGDWQPTPGNDRLGAEWYPKLEAYVDAVVGRLKDNPKVVLWDLMNEPEFASEGPLSPTEFITPEMKKTCDAFLQHFHDYMKKHYPDQLVCEGWANVGNADKYADLADVLTFHVYAGPEKMQATIDQARAFSERLGKKVVITETLSNWDFGSPDFGKQGPGQSQLAHYQQVLPILMKSGMGWISFGLVSKQKDPDSNLDIAILSSDGTPRPAAVYLEKTLKGTQPARR